MSTPTTHDPLVVNTADGAVWQRRAVTADGRGLYAAAGTCSCPETLMTTLAELAVHGIVGQADALPVPGARLGFVLSEQQIEALAAAGNRVVNDATHEQLCMCDAWPERCVSTGNYYMGAWDVSGLEDALPAVLAMWEQMRGGELLALRARVAELEAERHSTNEALDDAVTALRENTGRLVGLEEQLASANLRASRALIERDLMRESVSEPYGCTHCGAGKRVHGRRWLTGVGMHLWERPSDEQVKARMLARRSANRLMRAGA